MAASALYACTKCTQRYPFEELSQGQQLCKVGGRRSFSAPLPARARALYGRAPCRPRPACSQVGLARPLLAVSGGAEPSGHQSSVSQRLGADSLIPALAGTALSFHWEAGPVFALSC